MNAEILVEDMIGGEDLALDYLMTVEEAYDHMQNVCCFLKTCIRTVAVNTKVGSHTKLRLNDTNYLNVIALTTDGFQTFFVPTGSSTGLDTPEIYSYACEISGIHSDRFLKL